jgi:hypothetical protein
MHVVSPLLGELLFFQQRKKSNQKNAAPRPVCPSGPLGIRLCQRAALTRRPGSTRLNPTSLSDFPYQSRIPRQASRGPLSPEGKAWVPVSSPKTASLVGAIGQGGPIEARRARMASRDDPLAVKMAEGTRSASARGGFLLVTFFARAKTNSPGVNLCCKADPKGRSHGRDLQSNSPSKGETNA